MSLVYLNGSIMAESEAKISVFDRGFLYGHSVFETMPVYNYRVFRLDQHLERLKQSARKALIDLPERAQLEAAIHMTIRVNLFQRGGLRLTVSRGVGGEGLLPNPDPEPTCVVTVRPPRDLEQAWQAGVDLVISEVPRGMPEAMPLDAKTGNMLTMILASRSARDAGAFEAVLLDGLGRVTEGTMSNLFVVKDGVLLTPRLDGSVLPGVTRGVVIEIARGLGIEVIEEPFRPDELYTADEIWLTSSLLEIVPVRSLGGRMIFGPWPVYTKIREAYAQLVERECVRPPEETRRVSQA